MLVIEGRIIWPATFSITKELCSNVQLRAVAVNLHTHRVCLDTWKNVMKVKFLLKNVMKVKLLLKNVRSSLFALKMDVGRFSDMPPDCKSMRAPMVCSYYIFISTKYWLFVLTHSCINFKFYYTVVKLDSIEACCTEPGCLKTFTNKQCLRAHMQTCHQYVKCEICGEKKLRKNLKQHLRQKHESEGPLEAIPCTYEGCSKVFSTVSSRVFTNP